MNYQRIEQKSPEWWLLKVAKISGTRFGQATSSRDNGLIYELVSESLDGFIEQTDFENEDMQFGTENEPVAIDLYEEKSGIIFERGGVILSDYSPIHMASPDGINLEKGIIVEVKCTMHGKTQVSRFANGIDSKYIPQVINYFACSDDVKEVHWVSYCPFRPERVLVVVCVNLDTIFKVGKKDVTVREMVNDGRLAIKNIEQEVKELKEKFITYEF